MSRVDCKASARCINKHVISGVGSKCANCALFRWPHLSFREFGPYHCSRLAHARVLLFRPMLVRFCLAQHQEERATVSIEQGLGDHIPRGCATLCVENAQKMLAVAYDNCRSDRGIGDLPWWYRTFYVYIETQHLIAAMLRPDVFAAAALESWNKAISALYAHEHLSSSAKRRISSFQKMWQKVTDINKAGEDQVPPPKAPSNGDFQDIFQHLGFDADILLLGVEGMA